VPEPKPFTWTARIKILHFLYAFDYFIIERYRQQNRTVAWRTSKYQKSKTFLSIINFFTDDQSSLEIMHRTGTSISLASLCAYPTGLHQRMHSKSRNFFSMDIPCQPRDTVYDRRSSKKFISYLFVENVLKVVHLLQFFDEDALWQMSANVRVISAIGAAGVGR
jgi:hypothetical protein